MNRKVLIEGTLILFVGLASMVEGLRLILHKDPHVLYDPLGPGFYVLALSIGLMAAGIVHFIVDYRKVRRIDNVSVSKEMRIRLLGSFLVLALYILLIGFVGYIAATLVFCFLEFRVAGVTSWRTNIILTLILSIVYYVIFVKFCEMVFPKGILF